ncbi:MAG: UDP-N-acetylmuramate:L-alanyl-gamma-D-glutamyl-meso-diaminopimelate ligase, partial [Desulfocapsa sp.]|nr:UDP-N-acetylmuramate:L-alanyl-gamma-D-glutamyl-meso-diaminopimelate ligase [Desulfocapsa sp.]
GIVNKITVIDDFAHHPTAVKETLKALKEAYKDQRLITVFEPRTNSSRRAIFQQAYVSCFDSSELTFIREPVPLDNVATDDLFSSKKLAADLQKRGVKAESCPDTDTILQRLSSILKPNDVVAILSNGGFDNIHTRLLKKLQAI